MNLQNDFIRLIDSGISITQHFANQSQLEMYTDRYKKIIKNLIELKNAVEGGALATSFIYLGITQMLDHNDPKQLEDIILEINKFYCDNYRVLE